MKYYCVGRAIALVKLQHSANFFENLPVIGTPIYGRMPVTQAKIQDAFENSEELVFCKSLEDANKLRHSKITVGNTNVTPEFFKGAIAQGSPLSDYAIYEVEVDENIEGNFTKLNEQSIEQLEALVSNDLCYIANYKDDRSQIPSIEIFSAKKSELNVRLLSCHYLSIVDGTEEAIEQSSCTIS